MDKNIMFVLANMAEEIKNEFGCLNCKYNNMNECKAPIYDKALYDENFGESKACLEGIVNKYSKDMIELNLNWKTKQKGDMVKEFHVWLDDVGIGRHYSSFVLTEQALERKQSVIHTTQTHFLKTSILDDYRLFIHKDGKQLEITLGDCQGTSRKIKEEHNLERLVLGGEFDFG